MKKLLLFISFFIGFSSIFAQVNITTNNVAATLAQTLVGTGVTISNPTLNCDAAGSGLFTVTASNLGLDSGIILTSGRAASPVGGGFPAGANGLVADMASTATGNGGDPDLTTLINGPTFDKCILEFDFVTTGDSVKFDYVFGSEEYEYYTCSSFNDVFGFFLSGPGIAGPFAGGAKNIALVPGSPTCPVAISTIFCPNSPGCCMTPNFCFGQTPGCGAFNAGNNTCAYFVCNGAIAPGTVTYQGFTTVLRAESEVIPCSTYHIKLAIADKQDQILDSGVFLKAKSFSSNIISYNIVSGLGGINGTNPYIVEGCDTAFLQVKRKVILNLPTSDTVNFVITGTAQNTIDYNTFPNQIIFTPNPNDTLITIPVYAFADGLTEGTEFIKIYIISGCAQAVTDSIVIEIRDSLSFTLFNHDTAFCLGGSIATNGIIDAGLSLMWTPATGVLDPTQLNTIITPPNYGTFYYTATGTYKTCAPVIRGFTAKVDPIPVITPMPDIEMCEGDQKEINAIVNPAFNYNLTWTPNTDLINANGYNPTFVGATSQDIIFNVTSPNAGCTASDTFHVQVWPFAAGAIKADTLVCNGQPVQLWVSGGNGLYQWYPVTSLSCEFCPDPIANALGTTTYHAVLLDPHGCQDTLSVTIENHPPFDLILHNGDTTIYQGDNVQLRASGAPFYYWTPTTYLTYSQSNSPLATPYEDITYTVTGVSLLQGCPQTDSVHIKVIQQDVVLPNAFSPNGDGNNDVFRVTARKFINVQEFKIYNRWGTEVFSTSDIRKGWDGNYKGKPQDPDVYFYLVRVAYPNGKTSFLRGDLTLVR